MVLRLAFMGTPDFAVPTLSEIVGQGHDIVAVYSQPPRKAGRGQKERESPVAEAARGFGLPVFTPKSFKDAATLAEFAALDVDLSVVVAYGQILPADALAAPQYGCINLHASLLPRWRGAAPINRAILAGDAESGVCTMQMDVGLDTGDVLMCERVAIGPRMTAGELHDALAQVGASLMIRTLSGLERGALAPQRQPDTGITYAEKITKAEGEIDWRSSAKAIDRQVRGLTPSPGAFCLAPLPGGATLRLKVLSARPLSGSGTPGSVQGAEGLMIACGDGILAIERVQRPGKGPVTAAEFRRGFHLPPGTLLPLSG